MGKQITILMSTYNGERFLRQQIDSILNQQDVQLRLIVRDDGSSDGTVGILEEYQNKGKLKYYTGKNLGTALSFIQLLKDSPESDYYAFSDQDDVWEKDKVSRALSLLENHKTIATIPFLYAGSFRMTDQNLNVIPGGESHYTTQTFSNAIVYSCCTGCTMVFNKPLRDLLKSRPLPQNILMHDDWVHKVCLAVGGNVLFDSEPKIFYRQHGDNVDGGIHSFKDKIQKVWNERKSRTRIMSNQLINLMRDYDEELPVENKKLLKHALKFGRGNFFQRLNFAFDDTYAIREKPSLNHEFRISLLMNYW